MEGSGLNPTLTSYNRIRQVTDQNTGTVKGKYWYDDQGFRVRRSAQYTMDGQERQVELLYPSMYYSVETQKDLQGNPVPDTGFGVSNIYLNGVRVAATLPSHEYLPFGESWFQEDMPGYEGANAPKYNSQELDKETGYYFYNARHYDPEIARFVTPDTVIDGELSTQGWNRFAYVHNNPIRYKDPTGHVVETLWDIANIGLGAYNVYNAITDKKQDKADVAIAVGGLVADTAAALIPIVPGGVSTAIKLTKEGVDVAGAAKKGYDVYKKDYEEKGDRKSAIIKGAKVAGSDIVMNKAIDIIAKPLTSLGPGLKKEYNKYAKSISDTFDTKNVSKMFKSNVYEKGLKDIIKKTEGYERRLSNTLQKDKDMIMKLFEK